MSAAIGSAASVILTWLVLLGGYGFSGCVSALDVRVTGQSVIDSSVNLARENALEDALQLAALQGGVDIRSSQHMTMGRVSADDVRIDARSRVQLKEIVDEGRSGDVYQVTITAEVRPQAMCADSQQHYRKAIAVAGFSLISPQQASVGGLGNIEQALPQVLISALNGQAAVQALDASGVRLYADPRTAPAMENSQQRLTTSVALATRLGAQYVVSGVVRDLDMTGVSAAVSAEQQRVSWRDLLGMPQQYPQRQFAMEVFVHDGLSGALLFQRQYQTQGVWNVDTNRVIGFATPVFWKTRYGIEVQQLLSGVVDDVTEVLRCQPFMARIVATRGNRLHIEAGAVAGIHPGDRFQVYRTGTFYNLDLEPRTELTNMATEVVIKQVQPQFVVAELNASAEALSIQRDDLVIAW